METDSDYPNSEKSNRIHKKNEELLGIETQGLSKSFAGVYAVQSLDLKVRHGEIVGLLGANGAGKTTALRMLAGILSPSSGSAFIEGYDVSTNGFMARSKLGFLSGGTSLYARLTIRETLRIFGRIHEMPEYLIENRMIELSQELDLSDILDRRCGTLSSGQLQKTNIMRAIFHNPPVVILDEPTASLDVVAGHFIIESIRKARDEERAVLFSTHIMGEAEILCDRIVLLHNGIVFDSGTITEILHKTSSDNLTEAFLKYTIKKH